MRHCRRVAVTITCRVLIWLNLIAWTAYLSGYRLPFDLLPFAFSGWKP